MATQMKSYRLCAAVLSSILLLSVFAQWLHRGELTGKNKSTTMDSPQGKPTPMVSPASGKETGKSSYGSVITESPGAVAPTSDAHYPKHLIEFLNPPARPQFQRTYVTDRLSEQDLIYLQRALGDIDLAPKWKYVVFAICVLEEDEAAFDLVKQFVSTPWDWRGSAYSPMDSETITCDIMQSISNLAMIDQKLCGPFFEEMFTQKGAEKFLENWRNIPAPISGDTKFFEAKTGELIYGAAYGLLQTRSPELFRVVENRFNEIAAIPYSRRTQLDKLSLQYCIDTMEERDVYIHMGWDEGLAFFAGMSDQEYVERFLTPGKYHELANEKSYLEIK